MLFDDLDAISQERRHRGSLEGGAEREWAWMACACAVLLARSAGLRAEPPVASDGVPAELDDARRVEPGAHMDGHAMLAQIGRRGSARATGSANRGSFPSLALLLGAPPTILMLVPVWGARRVPAEEGGDFGTLGAAEQCLSSVLS
jgi:hypothetical protein